ncbi:hypothetical protein GCM10007870_31150 [Gluconobacter kondonii]|uniref:Uncharacterized protein n=1 Tax=Gluconobacter kondonii TaxID=941463 RepID=A0ABQ5WVF3_9PROT|nr:hypothetical protein AA3266_2796 [Gluconobacter kondonii NBRC 3266]GLQ67530.1 hypothetical protein GCM10007870_31150 [Gluconobacter kondonii]
MFTLIGRPFITVYGYLGGGYVGLNRLSVISSTCLPSDIRKITLYDTDTVVVPSVAPKPVMRISCFVC